jgi:hypothetical protein
MEQELHVEWLQSQLASARVELEQLRAQLSGDVPEAMRWLQRKTNAQRVALARLQRRVVVQRAVLRALDHLGRGLSASEWADVRAGRPDVDEDQWELVG